MVVVLRAEQRARDHHRQQVGRYVHHAGRNQEGPGAVKALRLAQVQRVPQRPQASPSSASRHTASQCRQGQQPERGAGATGAPSSSASSSTGALRGNRASSDFMRASPARSVRPARSPSPGGRKVISQNAPGLNDSTEVT